MLISFFFVWWNLKLFAISAPFYNGDRCIAYDGDSNKLDARVPSSVTKFKQFGIDLGT